jgi:hypothetical protein
MLQDIIDKPNLQTWTAVKERGAEAKCIAVEVRIHAFLTSAVYGGEESDSSSGRFKLYISL